MLNPKEIKNLGGGIYDLKKRNLRPRGGQGRERAISVAAEGRGGLRAAVPRVCMGQKTEVGGLWCWQKPRLQLPAAKDKHI